MTVLEVIQRSSNFLVRKGIESPRLHIELLLAHVLQVPRLKLYLDFDRVLTTGELEMLRGLVLRRGTREPLQHIIGSTSFCGFEIRVNRHVLVPRPETEILAEHAAQFLSALVTAPSAALDFGTGSGCLAIALSIQCARAQIHALDISEAAIEMARQNAARHPGAERIQFHVSDGFAGLPCELRFDVVASNPPYIPSAEIATLEPEVREFDPTLALDGGPDGLDFYRRLAQEAPSYLKAGGKFMAEFGDNQEESLREIFQTKPWHIDSVVKDYTGRARILIAQCRN